MKLIVDANVLFAGLIKEGATADILSRKNFEFYVPQFVYEEYEKHRQDILRKTHRKDISAFLQRMRHILSVVQPTTRSLRKAKENVPDPKDVAYIALALQLNCPIWSNDRRLKDCPVNVISTAELLKKIGKNLP